MAFETTTVIATNQNCVISKTSETGQTRSSFVDPNGGKFVLVRYFLSTNEVREDWFKESEIEAPSA